MRPPRGCREVRRAPRPRSAASSSQRRLGRRIVVEVRQQRVGDKLGDDIAVLVADDEVRFTLDDRFRRPTSSGRHRSRSSRSRLSACTASSSYNRMPVGVRAIGRSRPSLTRTRTRLTEHANSRAAVLAVWTTLTSPPIIVAEYNLRPGTMLTMDAPEKSQTLRIYDIFLSRRNDQA